MKLGVAETLQQTEALKDSKKKIAFLQANDTPVLRDIIKLAFDKDLVWALPEGAPPFKENDLPDQQPNLYAQWRKMYLFFPGGGDINKLRREALFIQFLESLDPADAKLICSVKDKKLPYKISKDVLEKAFPGVFNYNRAPANA